MCVRIPRFPVIIEECFVVCWIPKGPFVVFMNSCWRLLFFSAFLQLLFVISEDGGITKDEWLGGKEEISWIPNVIVMRSHFGFCACGKGLWLALMLELELELGLHSMIVLAFHKVLEH